MARSAVALSGPSQELNCKRREARQQAAQATAERLRARDREALEGRKGAINLILALTLSLCDRNLALLHNDGGKTGGDCFFIAFAHALGL